MSTDCHEPGCGWTNRLRTSPYGVLAYAGHRSIHEAHPGCPAGYRCIECGEVACYVCGIAEPSCPHMVDVCADCRVSKCPDCRAAAKDDAESAA